MRRIHARQREPAAGVLAIDPVHRQLAAFVTAGYGRGARASRAQGARQCGRVVDDAGQGSGFTPIRSHQIGPRQQQRTNRSQRGLVRKDRPGTGCLHRIDHQRDGPPRTQPIHPAGNDLHQRVTSEQARFDRGGRHIVLQRSELVLQDARIDRLDARDGARVLCGQRCDHRTQVHPECPRRAQVGGDAGAAAAVVAGDAPDDRATLTPGPFSGLPQPM